MKKLITELFAVTMAVFAAASCSQDAPAVAGKLTEALPDGAWGQSEWISAADAPVVEGRIEGGNTRAADGSSWFVTTVTNDAKVVSARWMTAGLGVYDIYVNGQLIGEEVLKPGFTHYKKTKRSFTYDITDAFKTGKGAENQLSAQVTPGWWADKIITPGGHDGMIGDKCAFRAVLELCFEDGSTKLIGTDTENWKAGIAGPVKHAAIFDGEEYDARELPGYACVEKLSKPEVNTEFTGEILPTCGAEVYQRHDLALAPVKAYIWEGVEGAAGEEAGKVIITKDFASGEEMTVKPGETLVVDFGQNCAGVPSFVFKAEEGTVLTCLPAELLNDGNGAKKRGMDGPEGSVHRLNLRIPDWGLRLVYTFGPAKGFQSFIPRSTFFGYRFVSVTTTAEVVIKDIKSIPVSSIRKDLETGTITTGDESINKLISNTVWGQRSNYLSVPTDCPQRDERLGWTADTQVFTETGTFFANTDSFFHKWMRDMCDTQNSLGGFPGVAPYAQYGCQKGSQMRVGWADAGVIVPWTVWKQFDDASIIDECWDAMELFMAHAAETKYDHTALLEENGNGQWGDWLSFESLESCGGSIRQGDGKLKSDAVEYWSYLSACYWKMDAEMMAEMAAATGRDAAKYTDMAAEAMAYIKNRFFNPAGEFKVSILNNMQTPALFALKNGIVEGEARDAMIARLRDNFVQHDNCLQTGFLGTSILMQTLSDNGMSDIAWELLFQRKNPSWLYSVDNGATTIWERWNSYTLENGMGPRGMNSFNHYAYGCVCQWIWETAAGIKADVTAPGFKHIIMSPIPDKRLGSISASYNSKAGLIRSEWKYEGDKWIWNFTIPEGASASVTVPGESEAKEYAAGSYTIER